ncbi:MAG: hypothetical protein ACLGIZ_09635 [Acidimicrobiia bacterium]
MSDPTPPPPPVGDHRSAKADAKAAKAREKAMRPWFKKKRFILPLILIAVIGLISVASGGGSDDTTDVASNATDQPETGDTEPAAEGESAPDVDAEGTEADDVKVESCAIGEFGTIDMKLAVTNNSSKRSSYFIDVSIDGADGSQIESGLAVVDNLDPGQSTVTDAAIMAEDPGQEFECKIVEVDRMSDE